MTSTTSKPPWLVGVAVFVVHVPKDAGLPVRTLICQRLAGASDGVGKWSCPGGCLDPDDDNVLAGAAREVREETGCELDLTQCEPLPIFKDGRRPATEWSQSGETRAPGQPYVVVFVAGCLTHDNRVELPVVSNPEPHKHSDWRWVTADELAAFAAGDVWDRDEMVDFLRTFDPYKRASS